MHKTREAIDEQQKTEFINKSNKLIAEFIGMQKTDLGWFDNEEILNDKFSNTFDNLMFHSSYDWLMPVVEKIWEYIGNRQSLFYFDNEEDCRIFPTVEHKNNKEDCYRAVVEFIKWYNRNAANS